MARHRCPYLENRNRYYRLPCVGLKCIIAWSSSCSQCMTYTEFVHLSRRLLRLGPQPAVRHGGAIPGPAWSQPARSAPRSWIVELGLDW